MFFFDKNEDIIITLEKLIKNWENEVVEFKEANNDFDKNKIGQYFSAISNEVNKIVSNENKIVSNSTESNVNVGTDSSQEAKTGDSEKSVHELLDKDVSKQTQINPIPFIIVLIIVFAVLIFSYYRYKKNE